MRRRVGPFEVGAIGLGCMNLSHAYGAPLPVAEGERLLAAALDAGVDFFDTAALYGFGANEELVGRVLRPHRQRVVLATKGVMFGVRGDDGVMRRVIDGRPETLVRNCEDSLRRLGTDVIDLYYLHRWDKTVPIEDSVGGAARLVERGLVRAIGLSEVSAPTLRRAHAVHPIAAIQTEYSLWTRNPEIAVLAAARELGVSFVAFSPLARAFLTGRLTEVDSLEPRDIRRAMPRFAPETYPRNLALLPPFQALAAAVGGTPAQLALAWLLARGDDIIPIPGTTRLAHLAENLAAADLVLTGETIAALDRLFTPSAIAGPRYNPGNLSEVDTEEFEPAAATAAS